MKLHWFLRASFALAGGSVALGVAARNILIPMQEAIGVCLQGTVGLEYSTAFTISAVLMLLPCLAVPVGGYAILTHLYGHPADDRETRCRACGYILRGISEPRCSECGERI